MGHHVRLDAKTVVSEEGVVCTFNGELYCNSIFLARKLHEEIDREKGFSWKNQVDVELRLKDTLHIVRYLPMLDCPAMV